MTHTMMYFFVMLDRFNECLKIVSTLGLIVTVVLSMFIYVPLIEQRNERPYRILHKWFYAALVCCVISFVCFFICPTTKQAAAIYLIPKIVNNERVQHAADTGFDLLEEQAQAWLKELRDKNEK